MTKEEVLSQVNYHPELTTANVVCYNGTLYNITRIDTLQGYKKDLTLYCVAKKMKSRNHDIILKSTPCCAILLIVDCSHAQEGYFYDLQL